MNDKITLKQMTLEELAEKLLVLRRKQFNLRMKKANGELDKTHVVSQVRREIARVKTFMAQKADGSHVK